MTIRHTQLLAWTFGLTVIGYPVAGLLAVFLNLPSTSTSFPFRALVVALSLGLFLRGAVPGLRTRPNPAFVAFAIVYTARLLWDTLAGAVGADDALFFMLLTVLIPATAIARAAGAWDEIAVARVVFLLGVFISTSGVLIEATGFASDRSMKEITSRLFLDTVNPVTFGHAGASTLLAALTMYYSRRSPFNRTVLLIGSVSAVMCIALAASRGPMVALAACLVLCAVGQRRWGLMLLLASVTISVSSSVDVGTAFRLGGIGEDNSSLERLAVQANALQMFLDNPFFGAAYADSQFNSYPHNVFIESAMALGLIGLALIVWITVLCIGRSWRRARKGQILLPALYLQYLIGFQFSGSLWGSYAFWACTAVLTCALARPKRRTRAVRSTQSVSDVLPAT